MNEIVKLEDYRKSPTLVIPTDDNVQHVVPVAYFEAWLRGEDVEPIAEPMLRVIVREWLSFVHRT